MTSVGITDSERKEILKIVAAVLYLGNITFTEDDKEQAQVADTETMSWFAHLIQCEPASVKQALCSRTISSGSKRASTYACPQNAAGVRLSLSLSLSLGVPAHVLTIRIFHRWIGVLLA